jgi:hypothetical protein
LVSLDVTTVSVSEAPCLAYRVPPNKIEPAPPEKTALETVDADAGMMASPVKARAATEESARRADRFRTSGRGGVGCMGYPQLGRRATRLARLVRRT